MQKTTPSLLTDVFSSELTQLFDTVRPGIVQIQHDKHGGGTGIVLSSDGLILTNHHVVPRDEGEVQVHFTDGRTLQAQPLQRNPELDLAILKVSAQDLHALPLADSRQLRIAEWVFAIGHPWGQRWAVTAGIVSAISTLKLSRTRSTQYIKSDVHLAPGNSGGPLLNADGEVIGVNAMIFGGDLSISIPSHVVQNWLNTLPKTRAILGAGVQTVALPPHVLASLQRNQTTGLLVVNLQEHQTSLLVGDIIVTIEDTPISNTKILRKILAHKQTGDTLPATIVRGGQLTNIKITVSA